MIKSVALAAGLAAVSATSLFADTLETAREFYRLIDGDAPLSEVGAMITDDYVDNDRNPMAPAELSDKQVIMGLFSELRAGFPDMVHALNIIEPIGEDRAVVYWTFTGTHSGPFFGVPASGNAVSINGVDILRIEDGVITEQWHVEELMALFQQIGAGQ